ncbi:hypothetical protein J437_LFUL005996 [Ladona fulva]|uniref:Uncharacterized protein n=1 Tax=Ladona fulva TaxID=123851 RepID=A0A8K0K085_LADFU|nr:hypothetical protein J437_LFUL005996 [Ladona fulva]
MNAFKVEKEIHHLLKGKKERNEERVDEVAKLWKKRRVFDWSLEEVEARGSVPSDSHHNSAETSIPENGEILGRDSEGSLSFLPQCHTPTDPLVSCQGKNDIEIITLSSDDSSEVVVIE